MNHSEYEYEDDDEDGEDAEDEIDASKEEAYTIQKILRDISRVAKKQMEYLVLEGFIEPTEDPNVYKYTPEGIVLIQQKYEKLREDGLL